MRLKIKTAAFKKSKRRFRLSMGSAKPIKVGLEEVTSKRRIRHEAHVAGRTSQHAQD